MLRTDEGRNLEVKAAGPEISGDVEVMEATKAPGDALSHLEEAVNGFRLRH